MTGEARRRAERRQALASVHAVLCGLLLLLLIQFLLLGASVEGWLAGKGEHLGAATAGSIACFAGSFVMLRYLHAGGAAPVARGLQEEARAGAPPVRNLRSGEEAAPRPTGRWGGAAARGQD